MVDTSVKTKNFVESLNPTVAAITKAGIAAAATGGTKPLIDLAVDQGAGVVLPLLPNAILDPVARKLSALERFIGDGGSAFLVGPSGNIITDFRTISTDGSAATRTDSGGVSFITGVILGSAVTTIGATAKFVIGKRGGADVPAAGDPTNPRPGAANSPNTDGEAGNAVSVTSLDRSKISTARGLQSATPRDLNEQLFLDELKATPESGKKLDGRNNDPRFRQQDGFQKMSATQKLGDGTEIEVHYQFNTVTGEAFDYKFVNLPRSLLKPKQPKGK